MSISRQRIFNKVARHLLTQGEKAVDDLGDSFYRTERDGKTLQCAAGCLISDDAYSSPIEGLTTHEFPVAAALRQSGVPNVWLGDVASLQFIHDHHKVTDWLASLREFAEARNLSTEVLNDF